MDITMIVLEGGVVRSVYSTSEKQRIEIIEFDPKGGDVKEEERQETKMKTLIDQNGLKVIY